VLVVNIFGASIAKIEFEVYERTMPTNVFLEEDCGIIPWSLGQGNRGGRVSNITRS
jgi:hypothetical protein